MTLALYLFYLLSMAAVKLSLLIFFLRLFKAHNLWRHSVYVLQGLIGAWTIAWMISFWFLKLPQYFSLKKLDSSTKGGLYASTQLNVLIGNSAINIITSAMCVAIPLMPLLQLQVSKGRKLAISSIFLLGGADIIFSILRLYFYTAPPVRLGLPQEVWVVLELSMACICSALPGTLPVYYGLWRRRGRMPSISVMDNAFVPEEGKYENVMTEIYTGVRSANFNEPMVSTKTITVEVKNHSHITAKSRDPRAKLHELVWANPANQEEIDEMALVFLS